MDAAHINGDPSDNRLVNLAWKTKSGNMLDKVLHGTMPRKLTEEQVIEIRKRKVQGATFRGLAAEFGVSIHCIQSVVSRKTWNHVA